MQGHKHAQEPQGPAALQSEIEVVVDPDPHLQPSQFGAPLWAWGLLVSAVSLSHTLPAQRSAVAAAATRPAILVF